MSGIILGASAAVGTLARGAGGIKSGLVYVADRAQNLFVQFKNLFGPVLDVSKLDFSGLNAGVAPLTEPISLESSDGEKASASIGFFESVRKRIQEIYQEHYEKYYGKDGKGVKKVEYNWSIRFSRDRSDQDCKTDPSDRLPSSATLLKEVNETLKTQEKAAASHQPQQLPSSTGHDVKVSRNISNEKAAAAAAEEAAIEAATAARAEERQSKVVIKEASFHRERINLEKGDEVQARNSLIIKEMEDFNKIRKEITQDRLKILDSTAENEVTAAASAQSMVSKVFHNTMGLIVLGSAAAIAFKQYNPEGFAAMSDRAGALVTNTVAPVVQKLSDNAAISAGVEYVKDVGANLRSKLVKEFPRTWGEVKRGANLAASDVASKWSEMSDVVQAYVPEGETVKMTAHAVAASTPAAIAIAGTSYVAHRALASAGAFLRGISDLSSLQIGV